MSEETTEPLVQIPATFSHHAARAPHGAPRRIDHDAITAPVPKPPRPPKAEQTQPYSIDELRQSGAYQAALAPSAPQPEELPNQWGSFAPTPPQGWGMGSSPFAPKATPPKGASAPMGYATWSTVTAAANLRAAAGSREWPTKSVMMPEVEHMGFGYTREDITRMNTYLLPAAGAAGCIVGAIGMSALGATLLVVPVALAFFMLSAWALTNFAPRIAEVALNTVHVQIREEL